MQAASRPRCVRRIRFGYAVAAVACPLLSGPLWAGLVDRSPIAWPATLQGLVFVAVTMVLLYLLLQAAAAPPRIAPATGPVRPGRLLAVFLALSMAIGLVALLVYQDLSADLRTREQDRLRGIADLKAGQIEKWLQERRADAVALSRSPLLSAALIRWRQGQDAAAGRRIARWLTELREASGYVGVELLDLEGRSLAAAGLQAQGAEWIPEARAALGQEVPLFVDLHRDAPSAPIHLVYLAVVRDHEIPSRPALAVLALSSDPGHYLYPLIQSWPGLSKTAETLLVRRDGHEVLFLNDLRHRPHAALSQRFPLTQTDLPAVQALRGGAGLWEGRDYRGVPVLAASRPVTGTPWHLVAKVDRSEVFAGIQHLALVTLALTLTAILIAAWVIHLHGRQQRLAHALALAEAETRFRATFEQAAVGISHSTLDGRWLRVNNTLCGIVGYPPEELLGHSFRDLTHPADLPGDSAALDRLAADEIESHKTEKRYFHKDGAIVWVSLTTSLVRDGAGRPDYYLTVVEDISQRKAAAARIDRLSRLYRALSDTNQAIMRVREEAVLFRQICDIVLSLGGFRLVWVGLHDAGRNRLVPVMSAGELATGFSGIDLAFDPGAPQGRALAGDAFRQDEVRVLNDSRAAGEHADCYAQPVTPGATSAIALPLRRNGRAVGVLCIGATEAGAFDGEIVQLCEEMALDLSTALDNLARARQLREGQAFLQALLAAVPEILVEVDQDKVYRWANPAAYEFFGEDLIGRPARDFFAGEQDTYEQVEPLFQSQGSEQVIDLESWQRRRDGALRLLAWRCRTLKDGKGRVTGALSTARDITERKAHEGLMRRDREQQATLRFLLETVLGDEPLEQILDSCLRQMLSVSWLSLLPQGGIFLLEEDGRHLRLAVAHHLPHELQSLCARLPLGRCICGRVAASGRPQFAAHLGADHEISYPGMSDHGHYNVPLISLQQVLGVLVLYLPSDFVREPAKEAFISSVADILAGFICRRHTEQDLAAHRGHLEELVRMRTRELEAARQEAERLARVKGEFLANMSHEIRTPMNAVLGFAQLGQRENFGRQSQQYFDRILDAGQLLLGLINDILDYSKIEAGKLRLEQGRIRLGELLDQTLALVAGRIQAKGLAFHIQQGPDLPASCHGDGLRLSQVLMNLLSNAVKFTEQGAITLLAERDGDTLVLRVTDSGIGMDEDQVTRLFRPFEQADVSTTRRFGGTGLGLTISQRLVELMQGEIRVASTPGEGTTFEVRLPLIEPAGLARERGDRTLRAPSLPRQSLSGVRVLVVDDSEINRELARHILMSEGATVTLAHDGQAALHELQAHPHEIDLVLMDIQMPVMDGYEAARRIRQTPVLAGLPIVALSAGALQAQQDAARAVGIDEFVAKPFDAEALLTLIRRLIGARGPCPASLRRGEGAPERLPGLDIRLGLQRWGEAAVYHQFLRKFAGTYADSTQTLAACLARGDPDEARALVHQLKGSAGNLALTELAAVAGEIERTLATGQDPQPALDRLSAVLDSALAAIAHFAVADEPTAPLPLRVDGAQTTRLLGDLLQALDTNNPDGVEPILTALGGMLSADRLAPLWACVEDFDFRGAEALARRLAAEPGAD